MSRPDEVKPRFVRRVVRGIGRRLRSTQATLMEIRTEAPPPRTHPEQASMRVLFVCHGNVCRSPMAEGILRAKLMNAGLCSRTLVASAGLHTFRAGRRVDGRARLTMIRHGASVRDLRTRRFEDQDFGRYDLIVAMDHRNKRELLRRAPPNDLAKVRLLLDYAEGGEVQDPVAGNWHDFARAYSTIDRGCEGLMRAIELELGKSIRDTRASQPA